MDSDLEDDHGASARNRFRGRASDAIVNAAAAGNKALMIRMMQPPKGVGSRPVDPNSVDATGATPLMWGVRNAKNDVVNLLLRAANSHALDLNMHDKSGQTALHIAVCTKRYDVLRKLLEAGANTEECDLMGRTPLCTATVRGDVEALRILADAHGDINHADYCGRTPLFHAILGCTSSEQRTKNTLNVRET